MTTSMAPIHPCEILAEEYLVPWGITRHRLAVDIGGPPRGINEIVHGKRRISADTALRLARYFGTSGAFLAESAEPLASPAPDLPSVPHFVTVCWP